MSYQNQGRQQSTGSRGQSMNAQYSNQQMGRGYEA